MKTRLRQPAAVVFSAIVATIILQGAVSFAADPSSIPDFTKGDKIPREATHDWTLGPTGARGWIYSDRSVTFDARQIYVTQVTEGSPADGVLQVGDVILGVGGKPFALDPRTELGRAITEAEKKLGGGRLSLIRWRAGKTDTAVVKLPVLGSYSATAPYDCPKSKRILEQGCKALARKIKEYPPRGNEIPRSLNALALLASGNPEYLPIVRQQVEVLSKYAQPSGVRTWQYGYVNILLAEYTLATGDRTFMPDLERITMMVVHGQSAVGSWGHGFADSQTGRLGGYGMMNHPGLSLSISLILAREAGVKGPALDLAIQRSERFLRFYIDKGSVPYGDHHPWIETHCDNGKNEMAAVMFNLLDSVEGAEFFSKMSTASHGAERDTGHTGNFFNITWALLGVSQSGPHATGAWLEEYGWYYDLARRPDGTFRHQGPPSARGDSYNRWDATGAYLLAYALPLKKIYLTGKKPSVAPQIDAATAAGLVNDGQGWNNKDRTSYYAKLTDRQILDRLTSWSPVVRERAAMELGRRQGNPVPRLITMLGDSKINTRYGACQALGALGARGAEAVPALKETLQADDLWLRVEAADALAGIGKQALSAVPQLLMMLAEDDPQKDPRGMEERYLSFALFNTRGGLLGRSVEGVDRQLLYKAVQAGLRNEDGRARGSIGSVYNNLTYNELKPLLPAIHQAIVEPAPSGIMFADGIRMSGLELFAKHRIQEGMGGIVRYARDQKLHGSKPRLEKVMQLLIGYGAHAKSTVPKLKELVTYFPTQTAHPRSINLEKSEIVRQAIKTIEASTEYPELIRLESPQP